MKLNMFCLIVLAISSVSVSGQGYYDDDIYYDASKTKKQEKVKTAVAEKPIEIEESGYQVYDNDPRDVDEYNRRNLFSGQDTTVVSETGENANVFAYTERLERFDNPEIVKGSDDEELKELYYANDVNIYIGTPSPYVSISVFDPWYSPWTSWTWGYPYGYWNAWYDPYYYGWHRPYYWEWGWSYPYHPWHYYPHYPHHGYAWNGHPRRSDTGRRAFGGNKGNNTVIGGGRSSFNGNRNASRRASSSYSTGTRPNQERTYNGYRGSSSRQESSTYRNNSTNRQSTNQTPSYNNNNTERRSSTGRTPSYKSTPSGRNSGISSGRSGSSGGRGSFGGGRSSGGRRR